MTGCRDCGQLTSGDCGAHGPPGPMAIVPCPGCGYAGSGAHLCPSPVPMYPCADCGALRTKDQGGTVFTVCDACWEKHYPPSGPVAPFVMKMRAPLEAEIARLTAELDRMHGVFDRSCQARALERAEAELVTEREKRAATEAAMLKYGRHEPTCHFLLFCGEPCSCGLRHELHTLGLQEPPAWCRVCGGDARPGYPAALRAHVTAAVERVVAAACAAYRKGGVGDAECQTIVDAVEAAAKKETT